MNNSRFSSLVYRIIGKPETWHDDYIDVMHEILDEVDSFDAPENFSELAFGERILSQLQNNNEALVALNTLLDKSRFKMIILDDDFMHIYHNKSAEQLYKYILCPNNKDQLKTDLLEQLHQLVQTDKVGILHAIDFHDQNSDQVYFRSIQGQLDSFTQPNTFHLLLVLDQNRENNSLNPELIAEYELTEKEENLLLNLIHGKSIKGIATESFVSENTIKTHMKSLFRKTGTNSQTSVVRLMLTHESQVLDSYFDSGARFTNFDTNSKDKQITLKDGQKIVYREYGPKNGRPLIVCHNGFGCRLTIPHDYEKICEKTNRRVIIPDRPGFGKTPYINKRPESWFDHLAEFIDQLQIQKYDLLGNVIGCQIALAYAIQADNRLEKLILASPVIINNKKDIQYLKGILSPSVRLVRASKRFASEIYELWLKSMTLNLDTYYRSMLEKSLGSLEREIFAGNGTVDLMIEGFKEGVNIGLNGMSHGMVYSLTPLKADLSKLTIPIVLWHGSEDGRMERQGIENLCESLPNHTVNYREGYSEHIYYALFEEIIA